MMTGLVLHGHVERATSRGQQFHIIIVIRTNLNTGLIYAYILGAIGQKTLLVCLKCPKQTAKYVIYHLSEY